MHSSPLTVRIMLACYYSTKPQEEVGLVVWSSDAGQRALGWLEGEGLIEDGRSTSRGDAWVDLICATPLPEQAWVHPDMISKIKQRQNDQPF